MGNASPHLRIVGEGEPPPRRGKGPGVALIFVGLYAVAFAGALWFLRTHAREWRGASAFPPGRHVSPGTGTERSDRKTLRAGEALAPAARSEYLRELSADCCDCGCDLTVSDCLITEQKCSRSSEMAEERLRRLR